MKRMAVHFNPSSIFSQCASVLPLHTGSYHQNYVHISIQYTRTPRGGRDLTILIRFSNLILNLNSTIPGHTAWKGMDFTRCKTGPEVCIVTINLLHRSVNFASFITPAILGISVWLSSNQTIWKELGSKVPLCTFDIHEEKVQSQKRSW